MKSFYQLNEEQQKLAVQTVAEALAEGDINRRAVSFHIEEAKVIAHSGWYPADGDVIWPGINR